MSGRSVRLTKVRRELLGAPGRTLLVVAAIAVGLAGVSTTIRARAAFTANLDRQITASVQSSGTVLTTGAGDDAVTAVAALQDVAVADGRRVVFVRATIDGAERSMRLVVGDLAGASTDLLGAESGPWPPPDGGIAVERSSLAATGLETGDRVTLTLPDGRSDEVAVTTRVHDPTIVSGQLVDQVVYAYAATDTAAALGLPGGHTEIAFRVTGDPADAARTERIAEDAADAVAATAAPVLGTRVPVPGRHVLDNVVSSLLLILGSLGLLSLVLSGFLVFNTMAALLARQRAQIGVMKAVGASRRDILWLYLGSVAAHSALALVVAVPIGILAGGAVTRQLGGLLNIEITTLDAPAWVWATELVVGVLAPMIAALGPVLGGTRATVAEVIRGREGSGFGTGRLDRLVARLRGLSAASRYAVRNAVRNKVRLSLTVAALAMGGSILVTVLSLQSSLLATVDDVVAYWQQDATVDLQQPAPVEAIDDVVTGVPRVTRVEGWMVAPAFVLDDGTTSPEETVAYGVPPDTTFITPTVLDGRWLDPADTAAAVINTDVAANEPDLAVGDPLVLRVGADDVTVEVVGVVTTQIVTPGAPRPDAPVVYLPRSALPGPPGTQVANRVVVAGGADTLAEQEALAGDIETALADAGLAVRSTETRARTREQVEMLTLPILALLAGMAVLFALVGGLGLLGTMSLGVLERTREVGLVRAVGAGGGTVLRIVLVEGLAVGAASWLLGSLLAVPFGWVMAQAVGISFIKVPLAFRFAPLGVALWFGLAVVLAVVASVVPGRAAARLSVREAIAHE